MQADLGLHCQHMHKDMFLHGAAQILKPVIILDDWAQKHGCTESSSTNMKSEGSE